MPQSLGQIYSHTVFATKNRQPLIIMPAPPRLHGYFARCPERAGLSIGSHRRHRGPRLHPPCPRAYAQRRVGHGEAEVELAGSLQIPRRWKNSSTKSPAGVTLLSQGCSPWRQARRLLQTPSVKLHGRAPSTLRRSAHGPSWLSTKHSRADEPSGTVLLEQPEARTMRRRIRPARVLSSAWALFWKFEASPRCRPSPRPSPALRRRVGEGADFPLSS
jgi:hypothetical protein